MYPTVAFVDATVLYSRSTRDWVLHLASVSDGGMFVVATSRDVVAEAIARLRDNHPDWSGAHVTELMDGFLEALQIVDDYDPTIPFPGDDEGDRHVHAAAIAAGADFLVTDDEGFRRMGRDDVPYEAITADDFLVLVDDSHPQFVAQATREQLRYWSSRKERADLSARLEDAGCVEFAKRIEAHVRVEAGAMSRAERRATLNKGELMGASPEGDTPPAEVAEVDKHR